MKIIVEAYPGFLKHCFAANLSLFYVKINNFNMYVKLCLHVFDIGEEPLQVARCTKIINAGQEDADQREAVCSICGRFGRSGCTVRHRGGNACWVCLMFLLSS